MAELKDILFDDSGDLAWIDGDLVWKASDDQHISDLLTATPGNYVMYPKAGCNVYDLINGNLDSKKLQDIRIQLMSDGYQVNNIDYVKDKLDIDCERKTTKDPTETPNISVEVVNIIGGVDGYVTDSDSTAPIAVPPGDTVVLPDIDITNSDASFLVSIPCLVNFELPDITITKQDGSSINYPAAKNYTESATPAANVENSDGSYDTTFDPIVTNPKVLPDITVKNSENTTLQTVPSVKNVVLSDITVTNSDGQSSSYPAGKNYTATAHNYVLREYTANDTWVKPTGLLAAVVICIGAGGGAGSGRRGASGTNRYGGGGGGGSTITRRFLLASELGTESIVIGSGGSGGASVTADDTDGNNGAKGGSTSFGTLIVAEGGNGGAGGSASAAAGGTALTYSGSTPAQTIFHILGLAGIGGGLTNAGAAVATSLQATANNGGPGGGGKPAANFSGNGGIGSRMYNIANTLSSSVAGGTANNNGTVGIDNYGNQLLCQFGGTAIMSKCLGTSGSGGGAGDNTPLPGGNGGNGGLYGGAGAGGGASLNGANSGKGGDGSNGLCVVLEIY